MRGGESTSEYDASTSPSHGVYLQIDACLPSCPPTYPSTPSCPSNYSDYENTPHPVSRVGDAIGRGMYRVTWRGGILGLDSELRYAYSTPEERCCASGVSAVLDGESRSVRRRGLACGDGGVGAGLQPVFAHCHVLPQGLQKARKRSEIAMGEL